MTLLLAREPCNRALLVCGEQLHHVRAEAGRNMRAKHTESHDDSMHSSDADKKQCSTQQPPAAGGVSEHESNRCLHHPGIVTRPAHAAQRHDAAMRPGARRLQAAACALAPHCGMQRGEDACNVTCQPWPSTRHWCAAQGRPNDWFCQTRRTAAHGDVTLATNPMPQQGPRGRRAGAATRAPLCRAQPSRRVVRG